MVQATNDGFLGWIPEATSRVLSPTALHFGKCQGAKPLSLGQWFLELVFTDFSVRDSTMAAGAKAPPHGAGWGRNSGCSLHSGVSITADPAGIRIETVQVKKQNGEQPSANGSDYSQSPSSPPGKTPANN